VLLVGDDAAEGFVEFDLLAGLDGPLELGALEDEHHRRAQLEERHFVALGELDGLRVDPLVEVLVAVAPAHLVGGQVGPEALQRRQHQQR